VTPITDQGALYSVCANGSCRQAPTVSGGKITQYIELAANFRNATRQLYSTTVFVELISF
jgi:hypothetical protein